MTVSAVPFFRSILVLMALFLSSVDVKDAQAQSSEEASQAQARQLFTEGGALLNARDYGAAEARFRQALALFPHPPIAFNLAVTLEKQGRFLEALEVLDRGLKAEFGELDVAQREQYQARTSEMRRLLAELIVAVSESGVLRIDGRKHAEVNPSAETRVSLDPGSHLVVVEFKEGRVERSVRLATSGKEKLEVSPPPQIDGVGPDLELGNTVEPAPDTNGESSTVFESPWFWLGAGAVIGGAVAAVLLVSRGADGDLETDPVWGISETLTGP